MNDLSAKTIVLVLSTMRAGSTMVKALLASAPDVSNLPEVNFQMFEGEQALDRIGALSPERIVVLKRPGWFNELHSYPRIPPCPGIRRILLVRDAYPTAASVRRMLFRSWEKKLRLMGNRFIAESYWCGIYENLLETEAESSDLTIRVRYEDILQDPIKETKRLFSFIGSSQTEGVDCYPPPENYKWKWGQDDGSDNIKTLSVQKPRPLTCEHQRLASIIDNSDRVRDLRKRLGYL